MAAKACKKETRKKTLVMAYYHDDYIVWMYSLFEDATHNVTQFTTEAAQMNGKTRNWLFLEHINNGRSVQSFHFHTHNSLPRNVKWDMLAKTKQTKHRKNEKISHRQQQHTRHHSPNSHQLPIQLFKIFPINWNLTLFQRIHRTANGTIVHVSHNTNSFFFSLFFLSARYAIQAKQRTFLTNEN